MNTLERLKNCQTSRELADLLNVSYKRLSRILYESEISTRYLSFDITKKDLSTRNIKAPNPSLKYVQKNLANLLEKCLQEIEIDRFKNHLIKFQENHKNRYPNFHISSHGFRKSFYIDEGLNFSLKNQYTLGIYSNAKIHRNKKYVLNIDIKDYFESIKYNRLIGFFIKNKHFELSDEVATTLVRIATYRENKQEIGYLPQGSPCSPVISNLFTSILDSRLVYFCKKNKCIYTRYADDITISTNLREFPDSIAKISNEKIILTKKFIDYFEELGFKINEKKTRISNSNQRQVVTGLVVNKIVNINKNYYKATRAMVDSYCKFGYYKKSHFHVYHDEQCENSQALHGILNYIYQIKKVEPYKLISKHEDLLVNHKNLIDKKNSETRLLANHFSNLKGIDKIFTSFLFHKNYIYNSVPLIICEGITDPLHFKAASKKLQVKDLKFTYLDSNKQLEKFLHFDGGTGNLKKFISNIKSIYKSEEKNFKLNPTIILVDRDDAGNGVITEAKKIYKDSILEIKSNYQEGYSFFKIYKNFYILQLPRVPINFDATFIEHLYNSQEMLNTILEINGNKMHCELVAANNQLKYSKMEFFKQIVPMYQDKLDYFYFKLVFDVIKEIQEHLKNQTI